MAEKRLSTEHGIICRLPGETFGYFGWPTVAGLGDSRLIVGASGPRSEHVCPFGKNSVMVSPDNGKTWSGPRVINDSPLDDRDTGVVSMGNGIVLVSWFTSDHRALLDDKATQDWLGSDEVESWRTTLEAITDEEVTQHLGSWVMLSDDNGGTWSAPLRAPVSTPHGPICLASGELIYLGKRYVTGPDELTKGPVLAAHSADGGRTWTERGAIPIYPNTMPTNYHELHVVELPSGKLIGMIRVENAQDHSVEDAGIVPFSMMQTESTDEGNTWTEPTPLNFHGSPPHLLRHSSGALVLTYGYRLEPYGQRVAISRDDGASWDHDWIVRDDGPDGDLGYPSTVELSDSSLFTVYYQKFGSDPKCSLLWSRWELPNG